MARLPALIAALLGGATVLAGCGARTSPWVDVDGGPPFDAGPPGFDGGRPDAGPPWACTYALTGEPVVVIEESRFREGMGSPELLVIDDAAETRLALGVLHDRGWHPEIHVAEILVGDDWPGDVRVGRGFVHVGIDAHGTGHLAPTVDGEDAALAWYQGDLARDAPDGVVFRRLDVDAWTAGGSVMIEEGSASVSSIVPWQGGYAVGLLRARRTEASVAILDARGALVGEPRVANPRVSGPIGTSVAATDAALLAATNDEAGTTFGLVTDAPAVVTTSRQDALPGRRPRAPTLRADGASAWAVWREESLDEEDDSFALRLARLSPGGELESLPLSEVIDLLQAPGVVASAMGALAIWNERRDPEREGNEAGVQGIVLQRVTPDDVVAERVEIPSTALDRSGAYHAVALRGGRTVILTWAGIEEGGRDTNVFLARLDCVP